MAFTGVQGLVDFYTLQEATLTNELTDIMTSITRATKETASLAEETSTEREAVKAQYSDSSSTEYKTAMDDVNNDYECKLSEITAWESELETQKQAKQTELQATTSYKESYKSVLKDNVKSDFKYAQS